MNINLTQPNLASWRSSFFKPNSVLRRTFVSILCILLVLTFIFQLLLYHTMYTNMKERVHSSNTSVVDLVVALSDAKFLSLANAVEELAWDPVLLEASVFPDRVTPSRNFEIIQTLKSFVASTDYVAEVALLAESSGTVFTSRGVTSPLAEYSAAADFSAAVMGQLQDTSCQLTRTDKGRLCLKFSFVSNSSGHLSQLLLYLETGHLFSYICGGNHNLCVYSADGTLIYSGSEVLPYTPDITAAGGTATETKDMGVVDQVSSATELHFTLLYPRTGLPLGEFLNNNANLLLLILVFLPLILLLALFCAWLFYRPMHKLLVTLPEDHDADAQADDWARLRTTISSLSTKTDQFNQILGTVSPYIQKELLHRLLDGLEVPNMEDTLAGVQNALPAEGQFLLFCTYDGATGVLNAAAINHTLHRLENLSSADCCVFSFEYRYQILTLVSLPETSALSLEKRWEELLHTITVYTRNLPNRSVRHSQPFRSLQEIRAAYQQITTQHHSAEAPRSTDEMVAQIHRSVRAAADQSEEAGLIIIDRLLAGIRHSDFSPEEIHLCCEALLSAMEDLGREYGLKPGWDERDMAAQSPDALPAVVREQAAALLHEIFIKLDNRQRKYFIEAKTYMENHYMDYDLSLNSIAEKIGISASYLSRIFASAYNMRFTQKLNELRIEKSKELLADESKLIRDIAQEVGFFTVQNFMRVFKQRTGITPSEYRLALLCQQETEEP